MEVHASLLPREGGAIDPDHWHLVHFLPFSNIIINNNNNKAKQSIKIEALEPKTKQGERERRGTPEGGEGEVEVGDRRGDVVVDGDDAHGEEGGWVGRGLGSHGAWKGPRRRLAASTNAGGVEF